MKQFSYRAEEYCSPGLAMGLIVLQTDEVIEQEVRHHIAASTPLFHSRIPSGLEVTETTLAAMEQQIPVVTGLFPKAANIGVVAYGCTSGTTVIGEEKVKAAIQAVLPGVSVTNPLTAVKARLRALGAKKIGLLTPYVPSVSEAMIRHFVADGFTISSSGSFFEVEEKKVTRISRESILAAMVEIGQAECDVVFASCTNLRTLGVDREAESRLGKPVISSNSSLAWHMTELQRQILQGTHSK